MSRWWPWAGPEEEKDPVLDEEVEINGKQVTLRQCREMAVAMADKDWNTPPEKGLAITVVYLIDRLVAERKEP